ncbi:MAG: N-acetyl sugar amidotransferase [Balneolaceae bacterium]|nr:MAG: N-acetyl sugar amidotransferase [Balneolaceae bacterium]
MSLKPKICSNCVMDTTDSRIVFDQNGVCDHCNTFHSAIEPNWNTGEKGRGEMERVVSKIKQAGKGRDFDCIIGMSGGFDSSYLTYLAAVELGLRPLVFHVDTGWNTQHAVNNIEQLVDKLNLDLFTHVIPWEEMKDLQLAFFKSGVPHLDVPQDHAIFATMYRFAAKYKVRYIFTGGNYSTECVRNPLEWMYYQSDSVQLRDIHRRFGSAPLREFPVTNILWHKVWLPYVRRIRVFRALDYMHYNKEEAKELLIREYGWQPYPQKHFESRFTRFYESYWLFERFGFDVRKVQFSSLILTGQMSREEALEQLKKLPYDKETIHLEFEYIANKLGITPEELRSYFTMPLRSFSDYRSQESVYKLGASVMRTIGLERGGKR